MTLIIQISPSKGILRLIHKNSRGEKAVMSVVHVGIFGDRKAIEEVVKVLRKAFPRSKFLNPLKNTKDPGWRVFGDLEVGCFDSNDSD